MARVREMHVRRQAHGRVGSRVPPSRRSNKKEFAEDNRGRRPARIGEFLQAPQPAGHKRPSAAAAVKPCAGAVRARGGERGEPRSLEGFRSGLAIGSIMTRVLRGSRPRDGEATDRRYHAETGRADRHAAFFTASVCKPEELRSDATETR